MVNRRLSILLLLLLPVVWAAPLAGQRTLEALVGAHEARLRKVQRQVPYSREKADAVLTAHAKDLEKFLAKEALGDDRFQGRFRLVQTWLLLGKRDRATAALRKLDPKVAPPLALLDAALWAERLAMRETRDAWIAAALARKLSFHERMEVATFLMTRLVEVKRGQQIFDTAYKAAGDDEARARVLWHQSMATRVREDLPEGAYENALRALSKRLPDTRYGGIARDRLRAMDFKVGSDPLDFALRAMDGKTHKLADYRGKVLLLLFWNSVDPVCRQTASVLQAVRGEYREKGLRLLGIALDEQRQSLETGIKALALDWPQVFGGAGRDSDIALRYKAERVPHLLLIGRDGKIAGMNYYPVDELGRRTLRNAVAAALGQRRGQRDGQRDEPPRKKVKRQAETGR